MVIIYCPNYFCLFIDKNNIIYLLFFITLFSIFIYSLKAYQPQGRYLLINLSSIITFFLIGIFSYIKSKKVLKVVIIILLIIMPYFAIQNLHTIQIEEEKISSLNNNSNNLLSKKWYREFAQIDQSDELHISVTTANGSRILTFGSIRLETKTLKEINFTAQTTNITKLNITPAYIASSYFTTTDYIQVNLIPDGEFHEYIIPLNKWQSGKPNVLIGLEIQFIGNNSDIGEIQFNNLFIQ